MRYNFIYFDGGGNTLKPDPDGYYAICTKDLQNMEGVELVTAPAVHLPYLLRWLFTLHNSRMINNKVKLPFKKLWYPFYFKNGFSDNKPLCFVIGNFHLPTDYLKYLKKKYPNAKFVKIHRDLMKWFPEWYPTYTRDFCDDFFDASFSFDEGDSQNYGFEFFKEIESKIDVPISLDYPICDVFFAGKVKDRLPRLLEIYKNLTESGLTCHYYLTGVAKEEQIELEGIEYADNNMPYTEMLYRTVNSKCVLELNQIGAVGYTSRFLEAVMFNKKLITDNLSIKDSEFFNPDYIFCFSDVSEISAEFVKNNCEVDFHYNNEFSPVHLIKQIDDVLDEE